MVTLPGDEGFSLACPDFNQSGDAQVSVGGVTRALSVCNGLRELLKQAASPDDWVLVHDAARCLITPEQITALIAACQNDAVGGLLALPLPDTLKSSFNGRVAATVSRTDKWLAQTPQMFRIGALLSALLLALESAGQAVTDESSAMEAIGLHPLLVCGSAQNFKVTYPEDFAVAETILNDRMKPTMTAELPPFRIGEGWDTHALVPGRKLIIGGIEVPHNTGLLGHSDADVLVHSIIDALLGAAGLGDIGTHFSDTDARFEGADSMLLLVEAAKLTAAQGYTIGNIDSTVIAQAPKLASHIPAMRQRIADALGLDKSRVNVKAKTAEKLGPVGQGLSMEARAVVLLI